MKAPVLLTAFVLAACGAKTSNQSGMRASDASSPGKSACEIFAQAPAESLHAKKTVKPASAQISKVELGMIQTAVLLNNVEAVLPQEALDIFTDKENGGSLGGDIRYFELTVNGHVQTIAEVTYYPGDNEYGALFSIHTWENGSQSAGLIGSIGDSDVSCLNYVTTR